jgi:thiol-disulfide isomerase/thioredoxin
MKIKLLPLIFILIALAGCQNLRKELPKGPWLGVIRIDSADPLSEIPVRMIYDWSPEDEALYVFNAEETIYITEIDHSGDTVVFKFPVFTSEIVAVPGKDTLKGRYYPKGRESGKSYDFYALYGVTDRFPGFQDSAAFNVTGRWKIVENPGTPDSSVMIGEFYQDSLSLSGSALTTSGDYRYLEGKVSGNKFMLSGVDGAHTLLLTADVLSDNRMVNGKFTGSPTWKSTWIAERNDTVTLPPAGELIRLKRDAEPFTFSFPGLEGDTVSLYDPMFRNQVVIVQAIGTWCPNCLDEALFYKEIYREYHDQGLEIVALCFEDKTFEQSLSKIKRFKVHTGAQYSFLYAGPRGKESIRAALYPFEGMMAYPTTVFIDRKGNIRKVETGFSGPGTGAHYEQFTEETKRYIGDLLEEE